MGITDLAADDDLYSEDKDEQPIASINAINAEDDDDDNVEQLDGPDEPEIAPLRLRN